MIKELWIVIFGIFNHLIYGFIRTLNSEHGDFGGDEDKGEAEAGLQRTGQQLIASTAQTGEEKEQYQRSFGTGKDIEAIVRYMLGLGGAPSGYLDPTQQYLRDTGELGQNLYQQTLTESRDPYAYYESTLQPQLELTQDFINRQAQNRGLLRSGIPIEQMGRAGVELAIKEAEARQSARANALARTAGLTEYISGSQQNRLAGLSNLYGQQQQYGLQSMGRQAQGAISAAPYFAYPYQAQLGSYYGGVAANQALPGQLIGAAGLVGAGLLTGGLGAAAGAGGIGGTGLTSTFSPALSLGVSSIRYKKNIKLWAKH